MTETAGLYVHIPFCLTRCGYCDFNTYAGLDHLQGPYVRALLREAELAAREWQGVPFVSIFLGGGTPTMLSPATLGGILDRVSGLFELRSGAEVTVEANPDTVGEGRLRVLRAAGVTRLSLGVQSFDPEVLAALERVHGPDSARRAAAAARAAGFDDLNLDLIYGARGETLRSWRRTLEEAVALEPEHLSCYALTVEPSTPLGRKVAAKLVPPPDPDLQADMYEQACGLLESAGYAHYEVSNWARPGHECVHNRGYWEERPYLGLGAGAHSYRDGRRWWNVRPPRQYIEMVQAGRFPEGGEEVLGQEERRLERLLLGLRTAEGVPAELLEPSKVDPYIQAGIARRAGGRLALTDRGMLLANEVVVGLAG